MKLIAKIDARKLRAAMNFQAKNDIRYYLKGVYLNKKQGEIQSSNGHVAFYSKDDGLKSISESVIINVFSAIPAKARTAELLYDKKEKLGVIRLRCKFGNTLDKTVGFSVINGAIGYPDFDRIKKPGKKKGNTAAFNADYMAKLKAAASALSTPYSGVKMHVYGETDSAFFEMVVGENDGLATVIIMPMMIR